MLRSVCFLALLLTAIYASAADRLSGVVLEAESNEPVAGANVMLKTSASKILSYCLTDSKGHFSLPLPAEKSGVTVNVAMMSYKPYSAPLKAGESFVEIKIERSARELKQIVVKSSRIRENGDTVTYNVGAFARKQDRTIGDVLRRMPGIDVWDNGSIRYQGADINKFYIEGSDLLGGKYGIATNGISHEDIGAVEVFERHQPMQVLRGLSFSDAAAINLRLKNKSKATFLVHGTAGTGWSAQPGGILWQGDVFTMMVKGSYQMITTFKGNNAGMDLSEQLIDHTLDRPDETPRGYLSLALPTIPDLKRRRSYFNRSWMMSSNHLIKTRRGELKARLDYSHDRLTSAASAVTTYFLETGDRVIVEDRNSLSHRNALSGNFVYEINEKKYYLKNTLSTDVSWNDLSLLTTGSIPSAQNAEQPQYSVGNRLEMIRRFGKNKLVSFMSRNEWNSLPERFSVNNDGREYGQKISQHSFYTDQRASLGFIFKGLTVSLAGGLAGYFRGLRTDLHGIDDLPGLSQERLTTDYLRLFASPKIEWNFRKLELTCNLPINLYTYFFSGGLSDRTEFFLSPALSASLHLTPRMVLTLRGSHRRSPASLHAIHDASILTSYRTFSEGVDDYYTSSGEAAGLFYSYRNAQAGVFVMASGNYMWDRSKFGMVQNIIGDYVFHSYRSTPSKARGFMTALNFSKSLDFIRGNAGFRAYYRNSSGNILSQGIPTDTRRTSASLSPFINGAISSYFNWDLGFTWDNSAMKISGLSRQNYNDFLYSGSVTLTPCGFLTWTASGEYYRNQTGPDASKNMMMLDTKLTFNLGKRLELSASVTNLLDHRSYSYSSFGSVSRVDRSSMLRGREFMVTIYLKK